MSSKAVQHEHNQCTLEAPPRFVIVDAPSTRLSHGRLVLTRAALRFILHKVTSNTTRHAFKNLSGLGTGPQVRWTPRKGIRKSFSESVLTKSMTVADPGIECVVQKQVSQHRTHNTTLRCALVTVSQRTIRLLHRGLQPTFNVQQDPATTAMMTQGLHQQIVANIV